MAYKLGVNAKLYYQTTGTRAAWPGSGAAPNLTEISNVQDLSSNLDLSTADVTTRRNGGWKATEPTLFGLTLSWKSIYNTADAALMVIHAAFLAGTSIALAALDGSSSQAYSAGPPEVPATRGWWANFTITKFEVDEGNDGVLMVDIEAEPTPAAVAPARIVVG